IEVEEVIPAIAEQKGPFYVRMGRADAPVIFDKHRPFEIGAAAPLREGGDVAVISTGTMTAEALRAHDLLQQDDIDASVIHMPTVKPIDADAVRHAAEETGCILTCEEHSVIGGLGDAVAAAMADRPVPMQRVAINDVFGESGEARALMEKYGLTAENIAERARRLIELKQ
ncbi:MAG: transketolase C-terminal domain-containing protein, partial [Thermoplasmatota archaeon]